ncbi:hypothetical protein PHYC_02077 [Phycisphaerales bacterium]|nr:hypothetical protein PHYC_02077 [Phycisphaerales bacterium]
MVSPGPFTPKLISKAFDTGPAESEHWPWTVYETESASLQRRSRGIALAVGVSPR